MSLGEVITLTVAVAAIVAVFWIVGGWVADLRQKEKR